MCNLPCMQYHVQDKPPDFILSIRSVNEETINGNRTVCGDFYLIYDSVVCEEDELLSQQIFRWL